MSTSALVSMPVAPPRPGAGAPRPYRFPHFVTRILSNGLRVMVASVPAYPVVTTLAVVEAGPRVTRATTRGWRSWSRAG